MPVNCTLNMVKIVNFMFTVKKWKNNVILIKGIIEKILLYREYILYREYRIE